MAPTRAAQALPDAGYSSTPSAGAHMRAWSLAPSRRFPAKKKMWGVHARESVAAQAARFIAARSTTSFEVRCAKQNGTPAPAKKTWFTSAGSTDSTAARSAGEGAPVGASIFPDKVNVRWKAPFSVSDINRHGTGILLQNEPDWSTKPYVLFHHKGTGCADRGMSGKVELHPRCEDAHSTRVRRIVLRQDEGRFAEIEFTSNLLHPLGRNAGRVRQNGQLITAERCRTENIDDLKCVLHEITR